MIEYEIPLRTSTYTIYKMAALGITGAIYSTLLEFV